ncbi:MAG: hypothetical protein VW239_07330 [Candidatus Nanopelagicales bacterium]
MAVCAGAVLGMVTVRALFLLCLALAGCSLTVAPKHVGQHTDPAWPCPYPSTEIHAMAAQVEDAFALEMIVDPDSVAGELDEVTVRCVEAGFVRTLDDGGLVTGEMLSPDLVIIATRTLAMDPLSLRRTAVAHEFVHVLGEKVYGDSDAEHAYLPFDTIERRMRMRGNLIEFGCDGAH